MILPSIRLVLHALLSVSVAVFTLPQTSRLHDFDQQCSWAAARRNTLIASHCWHRLAHLCTIPALLASILQQLQSVRSWSLFYGADNICPEHLSSTQQNKADSLFYTAILGCFGQPQLCMCRGGYLLHLLPDLHISFCLELLYTSI